MRKILFGFGLSLLLGAGSATAQSRQPMGFPTPEAGFAALADAAARHDSARLDAVLGPQARRLIHSGDPVEDRTARQNFANAYAAKAEILRPSPGLAMLQVGPDAWPLPIPLRQQGNAWRFDARLGAQELVTRRIGRNELATIQTLHAIADAQRDYSRGPGHGGALFAYAQRFFSRPGHRDGLYWQTAPGEVESPLGPLVAAASGDGYGRGDRPRPYHGYLFRILHGQGPAAPGGTMDYVVRGQMIGGFAVLAYPAEYGSSGIRSFLISHQDSIWESDLGPQTARIARRITRLDPGPGWTRLPDQP